MAFEENRGQTDARVRFLARGPRYTVLLTADESVIKVADRDRGGAALGMRLIGAQSPRRIFGAVPLAGKSHYLLGSDPRRWTIDVPTYARVRYDGVYDGVDVVYYGTQQRLEYDFVLAPGVDPRVVRVGFSGADSMHVSPDGDLILRVGGRELRQPRPVAFQERGTTRQAVAAAYVLLKDGGVGFDIAGHDPGLPLTIDPVLIYSTYWSEEFDRAHAVAVDSSGAAYVAGETMSPTFPTTPGAWQPDPPVSNFDGFVTKFDAAGAVVYSTFLGGTRGDAVASVAVDSTGAAYLAGNTDSADFPTTAGTLQTECTTFPATGACWAAFVTKLNASGSDLVFSTYLGGAGAAITGIGTSALDIALDTSGNVLVGGRTGPGFPVTAGVLQPAYPSRRHYSGFISRISAGGSALIYSTYLGGQMDDSVNTLAVDAAGNAYLGGFAESPDFPTTPGAFQRTCPLVPDVFPNSHCHIAFVTKINSTASAMVYSTFLGGMATRPIGPQGWSSSAFGIAVDRHGFAYVTGPSWTADFPTTPDALKPATTTLDAYVAKLNLSGTGLVYSTYLGGDTPAPDSSGYEAGQAIEVDAAGNAYVAGQTMAVDFPRVMPVQAAFGLGSSDAFVSTLDPSGSVLLFSSYLGGAANDEATAMTTDRSGNVYVVGTTFSADFPVVNAVQPALEGNSTSFAAKIDVGELPCGTDVTAQVDVVQSAFVPLLWPFTLQIALVWNRSSSPVAGPVAYVMDDLQNAVFVGASSTRCVSPEGDPLIQVPLGGDKVLAPNEAAFLGLWFFQTRLAPISYTPRLLSGPRGR